MALKINQNLLHDLNRKSINLDINRLSQYLSEKPKDPGNFRVRPMSGNPNNNNSNNKTVNQYSGNMKKQEFDQMSTATSFFNKNNASFVVNNSNQTRERPQTASQKNQQMIKTLQMNLGQQKVQEKIKYEDDLEKYIIETNHNNINNFNQELPLIENIDIENLENYLKTSQDEFYDISNVALKFDANCDSLQVLGELMPILYEIKLNNSIIPSIRDIGSSFQNLQILWVNRVGLEELQGINAFPNLKELYANYNSIKDLMPLDFNDNIEILDLEGNDIQDVVNIEYLETMGKLNDVNLSQNPITKLPEYRKLIIQKIPNLQILDENTVILDKQEEEQNIIEENELKEIEKDVIQKLYSIYNKLQANKNEEILNDEIIRLIESDLQKDPLEEEILLQSVKKVSKKFSKNKDLLFLNDQQQQHESGTSGLTDGTDQAFSGNPLKALRHNKKQLHGSESIQVPKESILKMIEFCKRTDNNALEEMRQLLNMNTNKIIEEEDECPPTIRKQTMKAGKKLINLEEIEKEIQKKQKEKLQNQNKLLFDDGFEVEDFDDENFGSDECEDLMSNTDDDDDEILQRNTSKKSLNPVISKDKSNIFKRDVVLDHKNSLFMKGTQQSINDQSQNIFAKKQSSSKIESNVARPVSGTGSLNPLDKSPLRKKAPITASNLKKNILEKIGQHQQFQQQQKQRQNSLDKQSSSDQQDSNSNSNSFMNQTNSSISTNNNSNFINNKNNLNMGNIGQTHNANEIMSKTAGNFKINQDQLNKLKQGMGNPIKFSQGNSFQKSNPSAVQNLNGGSSRNINQQQQQFKIPSSLLNKKQYSQHQSPQNGNDQQQMFKNIKQQDTLQNNSNSNDGKQNLMTNSLGFKKFDPSMLKQPIQLKRKILSGRGSSQGINNLDSNKKFALQEKNNDDNQIDENNQQSFQKKILTKFKPLRPLNSAKKTDSLQQE